LPDDFMVEVRNEEYDSLRSQIASLKNYSKYLPFAFTEQGVGELEAVQTIHGFLIP